MTRLFDHEHPDVRSLARMPLSVRRKLDEAGLTLTDEGWQALPLAARRRLFELPVITPVDRRLFASLVGWLARTFSVDLPCSPVRDVTHAASQKPWHDHLPPDELKSILEAAEISWRNLDLDARYALVEAIHAQPPALERALHAVQDPAHRPLPSTLPPPHRASALTTAKPKL